MVSVKKVTKPIIKMKDVFATDYNTYKKARKNFLDNPAGIISNQTGFNLKPQNIARINENAKRPFLYKYTYNATVYTYRQYHST